MTPETRESAVLGYDSINEPNWYNSSRRTTYAILVGLVITASCFVPWQKIWLRAKWEYLERKWSNSLPIAGTIVYEERYDSGEKLLNDHKNYFRINANYYSPVLFQTSTATRRWRWSHLTWPSTVLQT